MNLADTERERESESERMKSKDMWKITITRSRIEFRAKRMIKLSDNFE
jgi:hypothetical protein